MFRNETVTILLYFFFFNDTATTEIYTLSLHDALPISIGKRNCRALDCNQLSADEIQRIVIQLLFRNRDRKSTRLNSSHQIISYAVFCLKKKKKHAIYRKNRNTTTSPAIYYSHTLVLAT